MVFHYRLTGLVFCGSAAAITAQLLRYGNHTPGAQTPEMRSFSTGPCAHRVYDGALKYRNKDHINVGKSIYYMSTLSTWTPIVC